MYYHLRLRKKYFQTEKQFAQSLTLTYFRIDAQMEIFSIQKLGINVCCGLSVAGS